jgi:hypothetical protein
MCWCWCCGAMQTSARSFDDPVPPRRPIHNHHGPTHHHPPPPTATRLEAPSNSKRSGHGEIHLTHGQNNMAHIEGVGVGLPLPQSAVSRCQRLSAVAVSSCQRQRQQSAGAARSTCTHSSQPRATQAAGLAGGREPGAQSPERTLRACRRTPELGASDAQRAARHAGDMLARARCLDGC